jgi:hypothetical protein
LALGSGFLGLLLCYHLDLPSGPAIVLFTGFSYLVSVALGPRDSLRALYVPAHASRGLSPTRRKAVIDARPLRRARWDRGCRCCRRR